MSEPEAPEGYEGAVDRRPSTAARGAPPGPPGRALRPAGRRVVWSGRVAATAGPAHRVVVVATSARHGPRRGHRDRRVGNTRLTGVGRPPFPVELLDGAETP